MGPAGTALWPLAAGATSRAVFGAALIGVAVALLLVAVLAMRKALLGRPGDIEGGEFTLSDLRALRAQGRLTEEEFERARAAILRTYGKDPNAPPPPGPPPE